MELITGRLSGAVVDPDSGRAPARWLQGYVLAFLVAEVAGLLLGPVVGSVLYAGICFTLINHYLTRVLAAGSPRDAGPRAGLVLPVLLVLGLVAASRLAAMSTVVLEPAWYGGYAFAAIPLVAGLLYLHRTRGAFDLGDWPALGRPDRHQVAIAALGVPLAALAFAAGLTRPELDWWDLGWAIYLGVPLFALSGAAEELLYRGLLQPMLGRLLGTSGIVAATVVYTITHADIDPGTLIILVGANIAFGQLVRRTGSLTGVCAAHAVLNVVLGLVLPYWWPH